MILTLTANTAWDTVGVVPGFAVGKLHQVPSLSGQPGGKAVNVARVVQGLGLPVLAMGFAGGATGGRIHKALKSEAIPCELVGIAGESRTCLALLDPRAGSVTEVNEEGPALSALEVETLTERLTARMAEARFVVISGSAPPGLPPAAFREWGAIARKAGLPFALDTKGAALREGVKARPDVIKPNQGEAEELLAMRLDTEESALQALERLRPMADLVALSLGERGALVAKGEVRLRVQVPAVPVVSPVGCGDAFLAGLVTGLYREAPLEDAVRLAAACGAANATVPLPGCPKGELERLLPLIEIEAL